MALSNLLHLLAAMLWIGGMLFAHYALRPAAIATLPPPQRLPLMSAALGRFFWMVGGAIAVLLITGLYMIIAGSGFSSASPGVNTMLGGGLMMMAIFGVIVLAHYPALRRHLAAAEWPLAAARLDRIRLLVTINMLLGVLIVAAVKLL